MDMFGMRITGRAGGLFAQKLAFKGGHVCGLARRSVQRVGRVGVNIGAIGGTLDLKSVKVLGVAFGGFDAPICRADSKVGVREVDVGANKLFEAMRWAGMCL